MLTVRRRELLDLTLSQAVSVGSSVAVTFTTASFLGTTGRGQLAFTAGVANLAGALAFANLHVGAVHAHKQGDVSAVRRSLSLGAASSGLALIVGSLVTLGVHVWGIRTASPLELAFGTVGATLVSFNLVVLRIIQGLGNARGFRIAWTIQSAVYAGAGIPAAWETRSAFPVLGCWFLGLALSTVYAFRQLPPRAAGVSVVPTSSLLKTSLAAHFGTSGIQLLYRMDLVVLALYVSRAELGVYSVAVPIASMTWLVSEAISLAAFSTFRPDESPQVRLRRLVVLLRLNLVVGATGSLILLALAWVGLNRFLPTYHDSFRLIAILLPGVVLQGAARILFSQITSMGARRAAITIGLASFGLCLLYFPFCARWGATGAALASSLIYILQAIVVVECARRLFASQTVRSAA